MWTHDALVIGCALDAFSLAFLFERLLERLLVQLRPEDRERVEDRGGNAS